jgi:hypothetical protein
VIDELGVVANGLMPSSLEGITPQVHDQRSAPFREREHPDIKAMSSLQITRMLGLSWECSGFFILHPLYFPLVGMTKTY